MAHRLAALLSRSPIIERCGITDIEANVLTLCERITRVCQRAGRKPSEITIIAASKTARPVDIVHAYQAGIRDFGESRVQEAEFKIKELGHLGITWHMIGRLQSNKVSAALGLFDVIQCIDSLKLAQTVDRLADHQVPVLLEVNVSGEARKTGFSFDGLRSAFAELRRLPRLEIRGLMTIAPAGGDLDEARSVFARLRRLRDEFDLIDLSMGMSDDFEVAIEEGATVIRIGRAIFGGRT